MDLALNNLQWLICHKTKPNLWGWPNVDISCKFFTLHECSL